MLGAGRLGGAHRGPALRDFVGAAGFPEVGDGENAIGALEGGFQRFRAVQIGRDDFVRAACVLARVAGQRPDPKLAVRLKGADDTAALVACRADDGNQFSGVGWHVCILFGFG